MANLPIGIGNECCMGEATRPAAVQVVGASPCVLPLLWDHGMWPGDPIVAPLSRGISPADESRADWPGPELLDPMPAADFLTITGGVS